MVLPLPAYGYSEMGFEIELGIRMRRSRGGLIVTSRNAEPYWSGPLTTGNLNQFEFADYQAFLCLAVDTNQSVEFIHPRKKWPRHYATAADYPGPATANVASFSDLRTPVVEGLTLGTVLRRGDLVGFQQSGLRLARKIAQDTVVDSILAQAIPVTPRLPLGVLAPNCTIRFIDPVIRARVIDGTWRNAEFYQPSPISFELMEALI